MFFGTTQSRAAAQGRVFPWVARLEQRVSAERFRQVMGWTVVAGVATLVEIGVLWLLYQEMGLPLSVASALAAELLILARFLVQDRWVFGYARPAFGRMLRYHAAAAGAFVVSWVVLNGSFALFSVDYRVAWLLGSIASFAWSFLASFFWVWRAGHEQSPPEEVAVALPEIVALNVDGPGRAGVLER
jgi:putative flippase GtrA